MQKKQHSQQQVPVLESRQGSHQVNDFQLEHYKHILEEIRALNENVHKYLTLFQTLAVAIIGGGISVFVTWKSLHIEPNLAIVAIQGALSLFILLGLFITIAIIANVFSWLDYRKEEVELLEQVVGLGYRKLPTFRNFWRWSETYILLFIIVAVLVVYFYFNVQIIPLVK